jgi:Iap family predicted aminopeptidase
VAVHLGLGGLLLVSGPWRHWVIGTVLAVILAKAIFVLGRLVIRRDKARKAC